MLESLFLKYQYNPAVYTKSREWFIAQVKKLKTNPGMLIQSEHDLLTSKLVPGNCYLYFYDPKYKKTLPTYDKFPLLFPYRADKQHFWGLNFHYLHPLVRVKMLDRLMAFKSNNLLNDNTKLNFSWRLINNIAGLAAAKACIKQYRFDHIRSLFIKVPSASWVTAMFLPVESFEKMNKTSVYAKTLKGIKV